MLKIAATGLLSLCLLPLTACGNGAKLEDPDSGASAPTDGTEGAETDDAAVQALRAHIAELEARPEIDASRVKVQHILIAFADSGVPRVTRSKAEAEQFAAELYARVVAGEDFAALMREHSDDTGGGIYAMNTGAAPAGEFRRGGMVAAFGNVGWRLDVGQVGVAGFDSRNSPYGWHIVQRIE